MIEISEHQMTRMSTSIVVSTVEVNLRDMRAVFPDLEQATLAKAVDQIVRTCFDLGVMRSDCVAEIVRVHIAGGYLAMDPTLAVPLRWRGFSEEERVIAYLRGFEDGRRRVHLHERT